MPAKWKIFFALNIVIALPAFVFLILLGITFFNQHTHKVDYLYFVIFAFSLAMMTLNGFLNIFLLQRFYPDKLLPGPTKTLNIVSLILTSVVSLGLLILCIFAAIEEFGSKYEDTGNKGKIALSLLTLTLIIQIAILIMQGQLFRLITRNNRLSMDLLIDSIGQPSKWEN